MPQLELDKTLEKEKIPAGTILILQGTSISSLIVLHSGMAELISTDDDLSSMNDESIVEASHRVGLIKGESVCGILGLYDGQPLEQSIVAVSDCVITNTPMETHLIAATLQKKMRLNLQVLQALVQRIESANFLFNNYKCLWHKLALIQDSIALGAELASPNESNSIPERYDVDIEEYAAYLKYQAEQQGTRAPETWDTNVFLGRLQDELDLYVQYDSLHIENMFDNSQYIFFKRILRKQDRLVAAIFYKDEPTNFYVFRFLGDSLKKLLKYNRLIVKDIIKLINLLYRDNSWVENILDRGLTTNRSYLGFLHYLWKFSWKCHRDSIKLLKLDLTEQYPVYKRLLDYRKLPAHDEVASQEENLFDGGGDQLAKYNNLFVKIMDFSEASQEFKDEITSLLNEIKALDDILSTEKEAIQVRNRFADLYWKLYEICFLKIMHGDLKSVVPGIMLHFGLLDETLVSAEELETIDNTYSTMLCVDQPISAMTLPYFLEKIYNGDVNPSINEMGESFRELLKRQEKMTNRERDAAEFIYSDQPEDKVRYEIRMVSKELAKMLFGSRTKAIPILCSQALVGNIDRLMLNPEHCSEIAQKFRSRDYSLFYREVVCKHQFGTEIVKNEILPNFVCYPVAGSRMMMWQELDGTRKDSSARFFIPLYFTEKLEEKIGELLAQFRWELSRSVAGANWMDPVEGGLAGAYYDYIAFYKKNPNLSSTHKEKLADFIKKTRSDRDRFASDYLIWMLFEYEGKVRFNPVVRDLMYRFVTPDKEMRKSMMLKPLYSDLETKRQNRVRKDILRLESRFKKFEKSEVTLPREMEDYMSFLNS